MSRWRQTEFKKLFAFFLLALTIRLSVFLLSSDMVAPISRYDDSVAYLRIAINLVSRFEYSAIPSIRQNDIWFPKSHIPPLYPLFLAVVYCFAGQNLIIFKLIQIVLASFLPVISYLMTLRIFADSKAGVICALLVSTYPPFVIDCKAILTEWLFTLLLSCSLLFLLRMLDFSDKKNIMLSGIFLGLAFLCRLDAIAFIPVLIVYLFILGKFLSFPRIKSLVK